MNWEIRLDNCLDPATELHVWAEGGNVDCEDAVENPQPCECA